MDMYLVLFLLHAGPYLCFFGIVLPPLVTISAFWILAVWADLAKKEISIDRVKIALVVVFIFASIVSWGLTISFFRHYPILLD
jgi:hypothetical protein